MFATPPPEGLRYRKLDIPRRKGRVLDTDGNCVVVSLRDDLAILPYHETLARHGATISNAGQGGVGGTEDGGGGNGNGGYRNNGGGREADSGFLP